MRVDFHGDLRVRQGRTPGPNGSGGIEVDLATVLRRRVAAAFVLRAYPSGKLESVTDGGVDAESARRFGAAVEFAARPADDTTWNCELRIPLNAFAIDGEGPAEFRFNLGLRLDGAPGGPWFAAARTGGPHHLLAKAAVLQLDRSVRADPPNLLTDGTFESQDNLPWRLGSNSSDPLPDGAIQRVRQGLHQDWCIRIHSDDEETMRQRVIKWTHPLLGTVEAPGRYCLSYNVRVVGERLLPQQDMGSFNSYLHIQQNGKLAGNLGQRPSMLTTTGDRWIRRDLIMNVPANVKPSMLSLQLHQATGTVLLDNVSLIRCEDEWSNDQ